MVFLRLSELQMKMIVNINNGKHLGIIGDAFINDKGEIVNFTIIPRRFFKRLFKSEPDVEITYKEIIKIGEDVILVDL